MLGRAFTPQRVKQGNILAKNTWKVVCSKCDETDYFEDVKNLPDEIVAKKFTQRGWLLGKSSRSHDVCPSCIGVGSENRLAERFRVVSSSGARVLSPTEMAQEAAESLFIKHQKTDEILDRHFPPKLSLSSDAARQGGASPVSVRPGGDKPIDLNGDFSQLLINLTSVMGDIRTILRTTGSDVGDLKAAVELLTEQSSKTTGNTAQQVEAIARLAPLVSRNTEVLAQGFALHRDTLVRQAQADPPVEVPAPDSPPSEPPPPVKADKDPNTWSKQELVEFVLRHLSKESATVAKPAKLTPKAKPVAPKVEAEPVVEAKQTKPAKIKEPVKEPAVQPVRSHPHDTNRTASAYSTSDKKSPNKHFTFIRIGREIWDKTGLTETDRVSIVMNGSFLKIRRDPEGRKIKGFNRMSALLQAYNLGDINFKSAKPMIAKGGVTFKV